MANSSLKRTSMNWNSAALVLWAAALAVVPQAAASQTVSAATLISEFKEMCMATNASREGAISIAERNHWSKIPAKRFEKGDETFIEARLSGQQLLLVSENPGDMMTRDGRGRIPATYKKCVVMATVDDPKAVMAFAENIVGEMRPHVADQFGRTWFYSAENSGPVPLFSNADGIEAGRTGRFRQLMVSDGQTPGTSGNTALSYTVGVIR